MAPVERPWCSDVAGSGDEDVVVAAGAVGDVATGVGVYVAPVAVVVRDIELVPSTGKF